MRAHLPWLAYLITWHNVHIARALTPACSRPGTSDGSEPGSPSAASSQLQLEGLDALMVGPQPPASPRPPAAGGPAIRRDALLAAGAGGGGGEVRSRDVSPITGLPPGRQGGARGGGGAARSNLGPSTISRSGSGVLVGPPHAHSMSGGSRAVGSGPARRRASAFSAIHWSKRRTCGAG